MAALLARAAAKEKEYPHAYLADKRIPSLQQRFESASNLAQKFESGYNLAETQIQANQNLDAIQTLDTIDNLLASIPTELKAQHFDPLIKRAKALAWLRQGEQENCVLHHSSDSCLFPISGSGVHTEQTPSESALALYLAQLESNSKLRKEQWLAHIAAMTLGNWEERIPNNFQIDPKKFESDYLLPRFTDVAQTAGVDHQSLSGGGATIDFDNDGFLDLVTSSWGLEDQIKFYRNRGNGTFEDKTEDAGLEGITGGLNLIVADYNNDGFQDILILRGAWLNKWGYQPNSLLRNNRDGTFQDVTKTSGLLSFHPTQTAVFADFNLDGWLDLFIGNETTPGDTHNCELYLSNRDGTFRDATRASGIKINAWIKGIAAGDYDNDGYPDLFLSALGQSNILLHNDGVASGDGWQFTDTTQRAGVAEPIHSFPCWFWDYDNDGWEDLFVAGFKINDSGDVAAAYLGEATGLETPRLYRNNRDGTFSDVSKGAGLEHCWLPMGANFGDLDNDGYLDFYVGTGDTPMDTILPNKMYRNNAGQGFQDVTTAGGFGHLQKGHAISFADFDNDGDQDVHIVMGGAYSGDRYMNALFQNPGNQNNWLKLSLEGTDSNRDATGARIELTVSDKNGVERSIHRTVTTGGSFGCNPKRLEIGLGSADKIMQLYIQWPSGKQQIFTKATPNRFYKVLESSSQLAHLTLPATELCESKTPQETHEH
ncbi:CRTAC1 family protein [Pelagicoccus mobilis]|uniref:CRTAC1 family protein n=1 Tax=Pelagicoccus mobilis TaxID=415221 RepID=A0A934VRA4_9BACT|nr:CRTAC1 family protein [Pelagicoccus mobilis]MBK1879187.1 CRTAC1 family protein [Pelagicoccus mobilis]